MTYIHDGCFFDEDENPSPISFTIILINLLILLFRCSQEMLMVSLVVGGRQELFIKKERYLFFSLILHVYTVCSCLADILL